MSAEKLTLGYCINLDSRPDKWKRTEAEFKGSGITLNRFPGVQRPIGWHGCGAAHVAVAREAMRKGLPWVLVIEDDCVLTSGFAERWPAISTALMADDGWDIFLGGPTNIQGPITLREPFIEIERAFALHFYVLKACAYEKAIAWNPDRHGPIDVYYSDQFRIVTTTPILAVQDASVSDIRGKQVDYTFEFHDAQDSLDKLIYAVRTRDGTLAILFVSAIIIGVLYSRS
jgi:hypothetical protein